MSEIIILVYSDEGQTDHHIFAFHNSGIHDDVTGLSGGRLKNSMT